MFTHDLFGHNWSWNQQTAATATLPPAAWWEQGSSSHARPGIASPVSSSAPVAPGYWHLFSAQSCHSSLAIAGDAGSHHPQGKRMFVLLCTCCLWGTHTTPTLREQLRLSSSVTVETQGCFQTLRGWAESLLCSKLGLPRYLVPILSSSV